MKIILPKTPRLIIKTFYENGYEGFVVGGCVRDSLLEMKPNDWDMCTNAKPKDIVKLFENKYKIVETGLKHGTVTLIDENKESFEITTYRVDGEYENNRKPRSVEFTDSLKEDLSRRDFTINAMAYNDYKGLVDCFSGQDDLKNKIIRCVGNANERFNEDALRILRAYRFMSKLKGFTVDKEILDSSRKLSYLLKNISIERIREEFDKILMGNVTVLNLIFTQGIIDYVIPEIIPTKGCCQNNPYYTMDVWFHTIKSLEKSRKNPIVRLAVLLHDIGKPKCKTTDEMGVDHFREHNEASVDIAHRVLKRLKYDNKTIEKVLLLIENHEEDLSSSKNIKEVLNRIGKENFDYLLDVKIADIHGQNPKYKEEKLKELDKAKGMFNKIILNEECFSVKDLEISGNDLIKHGVNQGKEIGQMLNYLLEKVIENPSLNTKDKLSNIIKSVLKGM